MSDMLPADTRILVIDDEPGLLALLSKMLTRIGATPVTAETGVEGLELLEGQGFKSCHLPSRKRTWRLRQSMIAAHFLRAAKLPSRVDVSRQPSPTPDLRVWIDGVRRSRIGHSKASPLESR